MSLENTADEIRKKAKEIGLAIVPGYFGYEEQPIFFNAEKSGFGAADFVAAIHQAGSKVLLLNVQVVTEDDLNGDDRDENSLREIRKYLGKICRVQMYSPVGNTNVFLEWEDHADWAADFFGWNEIENEYEADDESEEESEKWNIASEALAKDPMFQAAKNHSQRNWIATKFFKEHPELAPRGRHMEYNLAREAFDYYQLKIQPTLDEALAEQAQKLLDSGLNRTQVAKRLKITTDKLKKLV